MHRVTQHVRIIAAEADLIWFDLLVPVSEQLKMQKH